MEWFTALEIAKLSDLTVGYVRNLACVHGWRRTGTRPQRYHIVDAMNSISSAKGRQT